MKKSPVMSNESRLPDLETLDPESVDSWEELARICLKNGKKKEFLKFLCDHIDASEKEYRKVRAVHLNWRNGEFLAQDLLAKKGIEYLPFTNPCPCKDCISLRTNPTQAERLFLKSVESCLNNIHSVK